MTADTRVFPGPQYLLKVPEIPVTLFSSVLAMEIRNIICFLELKYVLPRPSQDQVRRAGLPCSER